MSGVAPGQAQIPGSEGGGHSLIEPAHVEENHEEHEEAEGWLICYADLMTLLFGLFAMMFSFAKFDDNEAVVKVDKALAKYFGQSVMSPADAHVKKKWDKANDEEGDDKGRDRGNYSGLGEQLKVELDRAKPSKEAVFKQAPDGFEINFVSSMLFASGKADLDLPGSELIEKLGKMIRNTGIKYTVRVEGYTDDNPIHSGVFPSNWELSSARAAAILRIFEKLGFEPFRLMAIGYGSSRPAYPNRDGAGKPIVENQTLNRRVVVKVLLPDDALDKKTPDPVLNADTPGGAPAGGETPPKAPAPPAAE